MGIEPTRDLQWLYFSKRWALFICQKPVWFRSKDSLALSRWRLLYPISSSGYRIRQIGIHPTFKNICFWWSWVKNSKSPGSSGHMVVPPSKRGFGWKKHLDTRSSSWGKKAHPPHWMANLHHPKTRLHFYCDLFKLHLLSFTPLFYCNSRLRKRRRKRH